MITPLLLEKFQKYLGKKHVFYEEADLITYSYDAASLVPNLPSIILQPASNESLSKAIELCNENGLSITVRGAGTNLSGGTVPSPGGAVILTNALDRILDINREDMYAVVQPGVITATLAKAAQERGLFYPPDPGSQAVSTLGGNVAENAGGLRGLKYGVTRDYVLGLTFFDAKGRIVKTGAKTVKCATGYNLAGLLVGSEGTLGVFSEITLKLIPEPVAKSAMLAVFDDTSGAAETVKAIIAHPILPATLEYMDNFTMKAIEQHSQVGLPTNAQAVLLVEVDGHPAQVAEEIRKVESFCAANKATEVRIGKTPGDMDAVWQARRSALSALARLKPTVVLEDATVPRSKLTDMIHAIQEIASRFDLKIGTFGHAGDGNLHPTILTDRRDKKEWDKVALAVEAIFEKALDLGGTLSGEHGIGLAKRDFFERETNQATIAYSRRIKKALDPKNILNPGKIFKV